MSKAKKWLALTSGGDAPGMNLALFQLAYLAQQQNRLLYGVQEGLKGLDQAEAGASSWVSLDPSKIERSAFQGGTLLGTARLPAFKESPKKQKEVTDALLRQEIEVLFVLGGEGTLHAAKVLDAAGQKVIALPCSIDNDIPGTQFSIGFFSALERIVGTLDLLRETGASHRRIMVVEVMGHTCFDLAEMGALTSRAFCVTTALNQSEIANLAQEIESHLNQGYSSALVVVAEHLMDPSFLAEQLASMTGHEGRADRLGHLQRGGAPVAMDRLLAQGLASEAFRYASQEPLGPSQALGVDSNRWIATPLNQLDLQAERRPLSSTYPLFHPFKKVIERCHE